jgi:hypothetical protein
MLTEARLWTGDHLKISSRFSENAVELKYAFNMLLNSIAHT